MIFDENSNFRTWNHKLIISREAQNKISFQISPGIIEIEVPENLEITSPDVQSMIREVIIKTLRMEAKDYLPERLKTISQKFDLPYFLPQLSEQ